MSLNYITWIIESILISYLAMESIVLVLSLLVFFVSEIISNHNK